MKNKVKIMILINDLLRGGAQRIIFDIAKKIDYSKFDLTVVYFKKDENFKTHGIPSLRGEIEQTGAKVICVNGDKKISWGEIKRFWKIIKEEKSDILHTFMPYAGTLGRVIGKIAGIKHIISTQCNLPVAYDFRTYWFDRLTLFLADTLTSPTESISISYWGKINYFNKQDWQRGIRNFTIAASVDTDSIDNLIKKLDKEKKRKSIGASKDTILILMTARFVAWKGHRDLISAMKFVKNEKAQLFLIGWGVLQPEMEKLAQKLGLFHKIHFLGARTDHYELLGIADIYVQTFSPQPGGEIWMGPNTSQLEACAVGTPSISTKIPLIELLIEDGVTGRLAKINNPRDLAEKINWIIEHPKEAREMAERAKKRVREKYSVEAIVDFYEDLYLSVFNS